MVSISQHTIVKLSLIATFFALFAIYFTEHHISPESISIKEITLFDINKPVIIKGVPKQQQLLPQGHLLLSIQQNSSTIKAIFFSINTTLDSKQQYFIGRIKTYEKEPQLQIYKIIQKNQ